MHQLVSARLKPIPIVDGVVGGATCDVSSERYNYWNRPFPSSKKSLFQSEAKCEAIDMKMIFNYDANKTHFHNKGFALSLVLKVRCFGTRKWPISVYFALPSLFL